MCRSRNERDGGKRCPKETNPEAKAARNAKRREAYAAKKAGDASQVVPKEEEHDFLPLEAVRHFGLSLEEIVEGSKQEISHLSEEQARTLKRFTDSAYEGINNALYKGLSDEISDSSFNQINKDTKNLDAAFMDAPLRERITYRGKRTAGKRFLGSVDSYIAENYAPGSEVIFDGYQSTSMDPRFAARWASSGGIVFEMKTRSGLNVSSISEYDNEAEVLIPRSSRWKILSAEKTAAYRSGKGDNLKEVHGITVIKMVEIDENGKELTERIAPPKLIRT